MSALSKYRLKTWGLVAIGVFVAIYIIYLDTRVTERFEGRLWQLPARVYARPLELYTGKKITADQLLQELKILSYASVKLIPGKTGQYHRWGNHFEIKTRAFTFWDGKEKSRSVRLDIRDGEIVILNDLYSSEPLSVVRLDPAYLTGIFPAHGEDRILLKITEIPDIFLKTLVLVEDRRFFDHFGVDPRSIARALVANIKAGRTVQGGSTITQQLVKNLFLTSAQSLWRKINEAIMSVLLEFHYEKQQILETYINEIYLGQDQERAIHGFGLASMYYFEKPLVQLTVNEMALLVGMAKGASYYNPARNTERAMERRTVILNTMATHDIITQTQAKKLSQKELYVASHAKRRRYPAFVDLIKRQLQQIYNADDLRSEGLQIFTTLDPIIQQQAELAVTETLPHIERNEQGLQAAVVIVSPNNGDVLALVGDRKPSFAGFNRALDAKRPVGSLIKPVIYLSALRHPEKYTLATILDDTRLRLEGRDKKVWEPKNYDREYHGDVILFEAFTKSYNIPAARVGLDIGLANIINTLKELGSDHDLPPYPSITLGAVDMSPFDVASVYQSFAANGFHSPLRSVLAVLDNNGNLLNRYALDVDRQIDPAAISLVNFTLQKVTELGTAKRLSAELEIKVAGKTGTSDDLRDSWFAGFTGDTVAVVWTGYDDNSPSGLTGSSGAMRIWSRIIRSVSAKSYILPAPEEIEMHWIDAQSGYLAQKECKNAVELPFIRGSEPETASDCVNESLGESSGESSGEPSDELTTDPFDY